MAQTAVRKLIDYITERGLELEYEMEMSFLDLGKEQIIDAFNSGLAYDYDDSETYYNKTYNNGL